RWRRAFWSSRHSQRQSGVSVEVKHGPCVDPTTLHETELGSDVACDGDLPDLSVTPHCELGLYAINPPDDRGHGPHPSLDNRFRHTGLARCCDVRWCNRSQPCNRDRDGTVSLAKGGGGREQSDSRPNNGSEED